ncbi:MAG: hypothetical protein MJ198_00910 [Bacteroidales bacterium]|nr:hypothetical protein [Bacteroidales bacterium]
MANIKNILFILLFSTYTLNSIAQKSYFSGGYDYSVYICGDKSVQSWGDNYYGQLGRPISSGNFSSPNTIPQLKDVISIDAGLGNFCCALTSSGHVLSWGHNFYGELGTGKACSDVCKQYTADTVLGGETGTKYLENVTAIAVGQTHVYALLKTGEVVSWGNNDYGQLGNGSFESKLEPVYVKTNENNHLQKIKMIAAGGNHGYALSDNGNVFAWGNNQTNQLGCGNTEQQCFPQLVVDKNGVSISNITQIDGGMFFGLMLHSSQMVYGVGAYKGTHSNEDGTRYKTNTYAEFISGGETPNYCLENVVSISAGFSHSLAIVQEKNKYHVVSWGDNRFEKITAAHGGQIGNGNYTNEQFLTPVYMKTSASTKIDNAVKIQAGCGVSYIETYDEDKQESKFLICGCNDDGKLGLGDNIDRYFATELPYVCNPYCASYSLGKDKTLCNPISYEITTPYTSSSFNIQWFKDSILVNDTSNSLLINSPGIYTIHISDKTEDCPDITSSISIKEKNTEFQPLNISFNSDEITFKVIGDGTFNWYNARNGYKIGSGKTITTSKYFCEEIIADSIYQLWVEHENECQPIPLQSIKKTNCDLPAPFISDTTLCHNREYTITSSYDSLVWYNDKSFENPIALNDFVLQPNEINAYTFYITQIKDRCESEASSTLFSLQYCDPWYYVSGIVTNDFGNPINNSTVYLFCDEDKTPVDSCISDENGCFTLITHNCIGTILAKSPNTTYNDTWSGNKTYKEQAYKFFIDADIKYIEINLISKVTDIEALSSSITWESIKNITIYSLAGKKLGSFKPEENFYNKIKSYENPLIIITEYNSGEKRSHILIK